MATKYYIGTKPGVNGYYYIHSEDCPFLPSPGKRIYLGRFMSPEEAVEEGGEYFKNPVCCRFCLHEDQAKSESAGLAHIHKKDDCMTHTGIDITLESALFCGVN
jgi:hypothetical protein